MTRRRKTLLVDDVGNTFEPAGDDARIACFVPSITELLIDLGLIDRMVARTRYCIHPEGSVNGVPAIGGTKKVSLPKLRAAAPTHAILNVDENTREMAEAMRAFVPNVVVTHPLGPEDNPKLYRLMGGLFGKEGKADEIARNFNEARNAIPEAPGGGLQVLYFIWKNPWMTVSRDTYISAMLKTIGWHTGHPDSGHPDSGNRYPTVDITPQAIEETDLFLFATEPFAFTQEDIDEFVSRYDCPRKKTLLIDGEYCSWYGSRAVAGLHYLRGLAREIHRRFDR